MSDAINGKRLPSRELLETYLQGLGYTGEAIERWNKQRAVLAEREALNAPDSSFRKSEAQLIARLNKAEQWVHELAQRERQALEALDIERGKRRRFEAEVERLRTGVESERARAEQLRARIKDSEDRIIELRAELRFVQEERQRVEAERDYLIEQQEELETVRSTLQSYDGQLEAARKELAETRNELDGVVALLGGYQEDEMRRNASPSKSVVVPASNRDITVPLPVTDVDFPSDKFVSVKFKWYCTACDLGGELAYDRCPHCQKHGLLHDHSKKLPVVLKQPTEAISLVNEGYADAPSAPRGTVRVLLVRQAIGCQ